MRAAEKAAFSRGVSAEALMDQAGAGIARVVQHFFPCSHAPVARPRCIVFAGKGNNGGDALVAAAHLKKVGWQIEIRLAFPEDELGELPRKKLTTLRSVEATVPPAQSFTIAAITPVTIILDGLLGLGSKPPLRGPIKKFCREINRLRRENNAYVFAVDLPSGLDGDTGEADADCIVADFTLTVGAAKRGLLADNAINFVHRLEVVPLADLKLPERDETVACADSLRGILQRRQFEVHKNDFGRIGIVAGSRGLIGAAILCAEGALRAGAGLVRVLVLEDIYPIVAAAAPAEAMIQPVESYADLADDDSVAVWAVGPGLGQTRAKEILSFIERAKQPMVIDADALNILSTKTAVLKKVAGPRLLTPHPGEMKRLLSGADSPSSRSKKSNRVADQSRHEIALNFIRKFPVTLLLKGSRTIVAEKGKHISYNTTGNPGMATGGMGDVLTGVCAALLGQKLSPFEAARMASWICGRAAEIAIFNENESEQSLLPRDVLSNLGAAFNELQG